MRDAVDGWRDEMNTLGPFLDEMCELKPADLEAYVTVAVMWKTYTEWCERNDEKRPMSRQALASQLESRGVTRGKKDRGDTRVWLGIQFRTSRGREDK